MKTPLPEPMSQRLFAATLILLTALGFYVLGKTFNNVRRQNPASTGPLHPPPNLEQLFHENPSLRFSPPVRTHRSHRSNLPGGGVVGRPPRLARCRRRFAPASRRSPRGLEPARPKNFRPALFLAASFSRRLRDRRVRRQQPRVDQREARRRRRRAPCQFWYGSRT